MNIKIDNGKIAVNGRGLPITVSGLESDLQTARNILSLQAGSFLYDYELGSCLQEAVGEHREERLLAFANEALLAKTESIATAVRIEGEQVCLLLETPHGPGKVEIKLGEKNDIR